MARCGDLLKAKRQKIIARHARWEWLAKETRCPNDRNSIGQTGVGIIVDRLKARILLSPYEVANRQHTDLPSRTPS